MKSRFSKKKIHKMDKWIHHWPKQQQQKNKDEKGNDVSKDTREINESLITTINSYMLKLENLEKFMDF